MKRLLFFASLLLGMQANAVTSYFYYVPFYDLESKPYIETYFTFIGNSIKYQSLNGKFSGCVEITMLLKQGTIVKQFQKFNVNSPQLTDTLNKTDFIFVHRFSIDPGVYDLEIIVRDTLNKTKKGENHYYDILNIHPLGEDVLFSGVEYLEKIEPTTTENMLSKSGYDLKPFISDYFPPEINKLQAYTEIYNTTKLLPANEDYLLLYFISKITKNEPFDTYSVSKKIKTGNIIPVFASFDISQLPSGNYDLVVEFVNKENKIVSSQKVFFQRNNPKADTKWDKMTSLTLKGTFINAYNNTDSLNDFIKCLFPIANPNEWDKAKAIIATKDPKEMKQYIVTFWQNRNSLEPEAEWNKYNEKVDYVNKLYGSKVKKGYATDRGRVYLQYGAPDQVTESKHEPTAYPYEMWQYYVIGNQRNKHFVFYNPTLVGNDYTLLHSDARGEVYDPNWERRLSSRNNSMYNFNATESDDQYGSRAGENFKK
jgi:GWxTD domain-containing protein